MARPTVGIVYLDVARLREEKAMTIAILGVDLGKDVCSVVGIDAGGAVQLRRRMRRKTLIRFAADLPVCVIAMESCCGAHHVGRIFAGQGHEVRLMPPEYVRPYVKTQKNDGRDAEAIAEAASRPTMRFVTLKSEEQLDMQSVHRVRQRLVGVRRTLVNQLRAILFERGISVAQGRQKLERAVDEMLSGSDVPLSPRVRVLVEDIRAEWRELDARIDALNDTIAVEARQDEAARRLISIPGIGVLGATGLIAAIGDGTGFRRGRDLGAWLGLVPRQHSTGGKTKLLGISKRGNKYLRMLFIHGARAALPHLAKTDTPVGAWLRGLLARGHRNVAVVALANKLSRIAWAVLRRGKPFNLSHGATSI
jgi:transposase